MEKRLFGDSVRRYAVRAGLRKGTHFILDPCVDTHQVNGLYEREIASAVRRLSRLANSAIDIGHDDFYKRCTSRAALTSSA